MQWSCVYPIPGLGLVLITESTIRHVWPHLNDSLEYWDSLATAALLEEVRQCWHQPDSLRLPVLDRLGVVLAQAMRLAVERPLLVLYEQADERRAFLHRTREIVLRTGHIIVVREVGGRLELKTAFFPDQARSERPSRRWLGAVRSRVEL